MEPIIREGRLTRRRLKNWFGAREMSWRKRGSSAGRGRSPDEKAELDGSPADLRDVDPKEALNILKTRLAAHLLSGRWDPSFAEDPVLQEQLLNAAMKVYSPTGINVDTFGAPSAPRNGPELVNVMKAQAEEHFISGDHGYVYKAVDPHSIGAGSI